MFDRASACSQLMGCRLPTDGVQGQPIGASNSIVLLTPSKTTVSIFPNKGMQG
jgi:hypothetical protein